MTKKPAVLNEKMEMVAPSSRSTGWLARTKEAARGGVLLVAEAAGVGLSAIGAPVAAFTGKLYLAALIALFGLGCFLRFLRLGRRRQQKAEPARLPWRAPGWLTPAVLVGSAVEVAVLIEATRFPVRADQPGFETANWWWVIAGFVVLVWLQHGWLRERLHSARLDR